MTRPKIHIFTEKENKYKRRSYTDINPEKTDEEIINFAEEMNKLTENNVGEIYKVDNGVEKDLTPITEEHIRSILRGNFVPFADDDSITDKEIQNILEGNYNGNC